MPVMTICPAFNPFSRSASMFTSQATALAGGAHRRCALALGQRVAILGQHDRLAQKIYFTHWNPVARKHHARAEKPLSPGNRDKGISNP